MKLSTHKTLLAKKDEKISELQNCGDIGFSIRADPFLGFALFIFMIYVKQLDLIQVDRMAQGITRF